MVPFALALWCHMVPYCTWQFGALTNNFVFDFSHFLFRPLQQQRRRRCHSLPEEHRPAVPPRHRLLPEAPWYEMRLRLQLTGAEQGTARAREQPQSAASAAPAVVCERNGASSTFTSSRRTEEVVAPKLRGTVTRKRNLETAKKMVTPVATKTS